VPSDFLAVAGLLLVPVALVAKQPDLGTSLLILFAGLYVIFFAGLSWRLVLPVLLLGDRHRGAGGGRAHDLRGRRALAGAARLPAAPRVHAARPDRDPLGKGFHIIQGMIAIGSGGLSGKGFMSGTQTHLEFIPERTTDFIFAAFCEEFGLAGVRRC
jgi:rod shape determining protein RodA